MITLRDFFAGCTLIGIMACKAEKASDEKVGIACYNMADYMIKAKDRGHAENQG